MDTISTIKTRHSVRQFLDRPVSQHLVEKILETARYSPSGANLQPWQVAVVKGKTRDKLSRMIKEQATHHKPHPTEAYYPDEWFEPYKSRRFTTGMALYNALGIKREDKEARTAQWRMNYDFLVRQPGYYFFLTAGWAGAPGSTWEFLFKALC